MCSKLSQTTRSKNYLEVILHLHGKLSDVSMGCMQADVQNGSCDHMTHVAMHVFKIKMATKVRVQFYRLLPQIFTGILSTSVQKMF